MKAPTLRSRTARQTQPVRSRVHKPRVRGKRATNATVRGDGFYRTLIEHSTDAVALIDREGVFLYATPSATRILGYSSEEFARRDALKDIHPDDLPRAKALLTRLIREPNSADGAELRYKRKDGSFVWLEGVGTNLLAQPGVEAIVVNFRDITLRKRIEAELRESRDQLGVILSGIAQGITVQEPGGNLVFANEEAASLLGFGSSDELIQTPVEIVVNRFEVSDETGAPFPLSRLPGRLALLGEKPQEQVLQFRIKATQEERWSIVGAAPVFDELGRVKFAINIFRDISELRRAQEAMEAQREYLRVTLASIGDAVIATEADGRVSLMNPLAESLTGWRQSEAVGRPLDEVFRITDQRAGGQFESLYGLAMDENVSASPVRQDLLITRDMRHVPIEDNASPITDAKGRKIGVVLVFRDATERRKAEAAIGRLAAIVEYSEDAILGKNMDAIINLWNQAAERLYGYTADEIIGKSVSLIIPPDRPGELDDIMDRLKRGERIQQFETVRMAKDGRQFPVEVSISPVRDGTGAIIGASSIARDITKRKRAESDQHFLSEASELLSSSLDYEATLDRVARLAVPNFADWCAVHIVRPDGTIEQISLAHKDPAKLQLGYDLQRNYPPREDASTGIRNVLKTGKPEMMFDIPDELLVAAARDEEHLRLMHVVGIKSYMVVPLVARGHSLGAMTFVNGDSDRHFTEQDLGFAELLASRAAIAIDNARLYQHTHKLNEDLEHRVVDRTFELITANRLLEKEIEEKIKTQTRLQASYSQLRALTSRLQTVREEERTRIARELHDELGQALTALKFDLSSIAARLPKRNEPLRADAQQMSNSIDSTIKTVRRISTELRPGMLDDLGLAAAIEWQGQEFASRTGIECRIRLPDQEITPDQEQATAIFRVFQETLTNVARHSQATLVEVQLELREGAFRLQVRDNGRGFDQADALTKHSLGILGMRERVELLGGGFDVDSVIGGGTTVTVIVPLHYPPLLIQA